MHRNKRAFAKVSHKYPVPKQHDLSKQEKEQIRKRIQQGDGDSYKLAKEFGCSPSQIAGVKARLKF